MISIVMQKTLVFISSFPSTYIPTSSKQQYCRCLRWTAFAVVVVVALLWLILLLLLLLFLLLLLLLLLSLLQPIIIIVSLLLLKFYSCFWCCCSCCCCCSCPTPYCCYSCPMLLLPLYILPLLHFSAALFQSLSTADPVITVYASFSSVIYHLPCWTASPRDGFRRHC